MLNLFFSALLFLGFLNPSSTHLPLNNDIKVAPLPDNAFNGYVAPQTPKLDARYDAVRLANCGDGDRRWRGTIVHIGHLRYMTAFHVGNGICYDAKTGTKLNLVYSDPGNDFAILESPRDLDSSILKISCIPFIAGRTYHSIGWAIGEQLVVEELKATSSHTGMFFMIEQNIAFHMRVLIGSIIPGMSGGPIIDDNWNVYGINNATSDKGTRGYSREMADTALCK